MEGRPKYGTPSLRRSRLGDPGVRPAVVAVGPPSRHPAESVAHVVAAGAERSRDERAGKTLR